MCFLVDHWSVCMLLSVSAYRQASNWMTPDYKVPTDHSQHETGKLLSLSADVC